MKYLLQTQFVEKKNTRTADRTSCSGDWIKCIMHFLRLSPFYVYRCLILVLFNYLFARYSNFASLWLVFDSVFGCLLVFLLQFCCISLPAPLSFDSFPLSLSRSVTGALVRSTKKKTRSALSDDNSNEHQQLCTSVRLCVCARRTNCLY